ncbi:MAG: hypothetical protein OEZ09_16620, partial [Betaproteobacteria bacterium]|nr:hypothetical protein [Betaproteobacteria bacterium]
TPGAEVVVHEPGSYRVETDRSGWTELVVRDGFAELVTARGSTVVRGGEAATTYGERWSGVEISAAGSEDSLERWGSELLARARTSSAAELHVEPELAYGAAPLREWGTWVSYDSDWYWRPRVGVDWRPYWQGRWAWTPSGLTWVSSEPWGWVPYHYGAWSRIPGYGWAWRPGRVYSPAWVYWHWSDSWVGWVPVGYYTGWYGPGYYGSGFRFGVYGWSSGGWDLYTSWNFGPTDCLRRRHQRDHYRRGGDLARELGPRVPRGLVTTDTRGLPRHGFADEGVGSRELLRRAQRRIDRTPLVDVTDFVGRRRDLPPPVERAIRTEPGAKIRLADVPRAEMDSELQGRTVPRRDRVGDVVPVQGGGGSRVGRSDPVAGGALGEPSPRDRDRARVAPGGEVERGRPAVAPRAPAEGTDLNPRYDLERRGVPNPRPEAPRAPAEGTDFNPRYDLER